MPGGGESGACEAATRWLSGDLTGCATHPWKGRDVESPKGRGRFLWTDGYRCAVAGDFAAWLMDLAEVRLVEPTAARSKLEKECHHHFPLF